jgi:hypothetical protein
MTTPQIVYLVEHEYDSYVFHDYKEALRFFEALNTAQAVKQDYSAKNLTYIKNENKHTLLKRVTNVTLLDEPITEQPITEISTVEEIA